MNSRAQFPVVPKSGAGSRRLLRGMSGFTMVEIAICLAVIGFALVAILGVLPTGMQVQRDNREETIINQDGPYFMEAIRNGARGLDHLTNYVVSMGVTYTNGLYRECLPLGAPDKLLTGARIIGALSTPAGRPCVPACDPTVGNELVYRTHVRVRSMSGAANEKGDKNTITFEYLLTSEIISMPAVNINYFGTNHQAQLLNNLHEVRLIFRWPVLPNGQAGVGRKVFRSYVSGSVNVESTLGYFFEPDTFTAVRP